jgi:hypothetical protein
LHQPWDLPVWSLKNIKGNIYGLYVNDELKYIGERQKGNLTNRLNTHFHCCPEGTKSKLDKVKEAFSEKNKVSYKTLLIEPDYER